MNSVTSVDVADFEEILEIACSDMVGSGPPHVIANTLPSSFFFATLGKICDRHSHFFISAQPT